MSTPSALATRQDQYRHVDSFDEAVPASGRRIVLRSSGYQHGPITRLVSPPLVSSLPLSITYLSTMEFHMSTSSASVVGDSNPAVFADQIQMIMFMKNVAITGGFLLLVANGAGALSLDRRLSK